MARAIKQYRYYNANNNKNQPSTATKEQFINGLVFELPSCFPILQLGIQALPGTKFYMNSAIDPVVVGFTGIYELDLDNRAEIIKLSFDKESMNAIENNQNGYLIVDVLYDDGKEEI